MAPKMCLLLLVLMLRSTLGMWVPKILWSYWDDPITPQSTLELFHLNQLNMATDWDVRLLNRDNYYDYLKQIPDFKGFPDNFKNLILQHKTDYIRITLLRHYGGVWMDFSSILTEDLSWLEADQLRSNPDVENVYGEQPDILLFTFYKYGTKRVLKEPMTQKNYQVLPGYEIWFLAVKPYTEFISKLYELAIQRLKQNYYQVAQSTSINNTRWFKITNGSKINLRGCSRPYLLMNQIMQYLIQNKQHQLDKGSSGQSRQLAVWYYKVWHINSDKGPFSLFLDPTILVQVGYWDMVSKFNTEQLRILGFRTRYFIKMVGMVRREVVGHLDAYLHPPNNFLQAVYYTIKYHSYDMINAYFCPKQYEIQTDTIIRKYLIIPDEFSIAQPSKIKRINECVDIKVYEIEAALLVIILTVLLFLMTVYLIINKCQEKKARQEQRSKKSMRRWRQSLVNIDTEMEQIQQQDGQKYRVKNRR